MSVPFASPKVRLAIDELVVSAEQLQLMLTRAAVVGHPMHPALERLALGALGAASRGLHAAASFVAEDTVRLRDTSANPATVAWRDPRGGSGR